MGRCTFLLDRFLKEYRNELNNERTIKNDNDRTIVFRDMKAYFRIMKKNKVSEIRIRDKDVDSEIKNSIMQYQIKNDLSTYRKLYDSLSMLTNAILKREYKRITSFYRGIKRTSQNPINPECLVHRTIRGEMVRSKSEVIIANALHASKIDYYYEMKVKNYYPDFVIPLSIQGRTIYWEHCGRIDDYDYACRWIEKKRKYERMGITEGVNLIVTYDSASGSIDSREIEEIITKWFKP